MIFLSCCYSNCIAEPYLLVLAFINFCLGVKPKHYFVWPFQWPRVVQKIDCLHVTKVTFLVNLDI